MADTSHVRIDALDVNNWATWNIRMKALLIQKGLWAMIGPAAEGDGEVDEARDQKALALIILNVKDHHLLTVAHSETARAA